jgi:hypothetical protein
MPSHLISFNDESLQWPLSAMTAEKNKLTAENNKLTAENNKLGVAACAWKTGPYRSFVVLTRRQAVLSLRAVTVLKPDSVVTRNVRTGQLSVNRLVPPVLDM